MGWPPSTDFSPPSSSAAIDWGKQVTQDIRNDFVKSMDGVLSDLSGIFGGTTPCSDLLRTAPFAVERKLYPFYAKMVRRSLDPLIKWIASRPIIRRDPQPKIWHLKNPYLAFHGGDVSGDTNWEEITTHQQYIDIFRGPPWGNPIWYVHGMGQPPDRMNAVNYWRSFEREYRLFDSVTVRHPAIFVTWDSEVRDIDLGIILGTLAAGNIASSELAAAIMFREMQDRALRVADYIAPIFTSSADFYSMSVTHSLGSYIWSSVTSQSSFVTSHRWWSFEAAVLSDAYTSTGEFPVCGRLFRNFNETEYNEIKIWHSELDAVLGGLYVLGTGSTAMGQTGPILDPGTEMSTINVTREAGETHGPGELTPHASGYFARIGNIIRREKKPPF